MKKLFLILIILFILFPIPAFAQDDIYSTSPNYYTEPTWSPSNNKSSDISNVISRFRNHRVFNKLNGTIPQVVEVKFPLGSNYSHVDLALVEDETTTLQPFTLIKGSIGPASMQPAVRAIDDSKIKNIENLSDGDFYTYSDLPVTSEIQTKGVIQFSYVNPITAENINIVFDNNSSYPASYSLATIDASGNREVVVADTIFSNNIRFPKRTSLTWELTLRYSQPLRIMEISIPEFPINIQNQDKIRFLMRPGTPYILFSSPDGYVKMPYLEAGNLTSVPDVLTLSLPTEESNPLYKPPDDDGDGVINNDDNCPTITNKNQENKNNNNLGDACEDFDKDGVLNFNDNCQDHPNVAQKDTDGDGKGDHCDDEESRLTERLGFLPWLGIGLGFAVVIGIFAVTVKKKPLVTDLKTPSQPDTSATTKKK